MMSSFPRTAMVMAAGLGTRMRPLTESLPKPLIAVNGITLIDRALDWLGASGVTTAVVNSFYKAGLLEAHLASRSQPAIVISREPALLDTGGGLLNALPRLGNAPFFSINSDVICLDGSRPALHRLAEQWNPRTMDGLLLVHKVEHAVGYAGAGDFFTDQENRLRRRGPHAAAPFVFTGVQLLHPRLFTAAPAGAFSLNLLYDRGKQADGTLPRLHALVHDGAWLHVGDPHGLALAGEYLQRL